MEAAIVAVDHLQHRRAHPREDQRQCVGDLDPPDDGARRHSHGFGRVPDGGVHRLDPGEGPRHDGRDREQDQSNDARHDEGRRPPDEGPHPQRKSEEEAERRDRAGRVGHGHQPVQPPGMPDVEPHRDADGGRDEHDEERVAHVFAESDRNAVRACPRLRRCEPLPDRGDHARATCVLTQGVSRAPSPRMTTSKTSASTRQATIPVSSSPGMSRL